MSGARADTPETSDDAAREAIRRRFERLQTAIVCDVYDDEDREPTALATDLARRSGEGTFAGWAYPIAGQFAPDEGADRRKLQAADAMEPGQVALWSGSDARGICLFGDLIAATMQARGAVGAVVDGGFRDVRQIRATGFPVVARYTSPVQAIGRWRVTRVNEPVTVRGAFGERVTVAPGDMILADDDGVVVVPAHEVTHVLEAAEAILAKEAEQRERGAEGMTALEMLEKYGHV